MEDQVLLSQHLQKLCEEGVYSRKYFFCHIILSMKFLLWFGMSQTGKSSSVKLLTGDETIQCGVYGKARSTTSSIQVYQERQPKLSQRFHHIDTIGLGDNRLIYNDQEIRNQIENGIIRISRTNNVDSISAIVVTESLRADLLSLKPVFQHINSILGHFPRQSIIILGTKKNSCNHGYYDSKLEEIQDVMKQSGIPQDHYIDFSTPCPQENIIESQINPAQYAELSKLIQMCPQVRLKSISEKQEKIRARALLIQEQKTIINTQYVDRQQIEFRKEKQQKTVYKPHDRWAGDLGKVLGLKRTKWIEETVEEEVDVPSIKTVKEAIEIPVVPEYDYCYRLALEEFDKQFVASCLVKGQ